MSPRRHAHPEDPLERMLHQLGREARGTPFDPELPKRVERRVRLELERKTLEPVAASLGAVAAALVLALGAWFFPPDSTASHPATTLPAPEIPEPATRPEPDPDPGEPLR